MIDRQMKIDTVLQYVVVIVSASDPHQTPHLPCV